MNLFCFGLQSKDEVTLNNAFLYRSEFDENGMARAIINDLSWLKFGDVVVIDRDYNVLDRTGMFCDDINSLGVCWRENHIVAHEVSIKPRGISAYFLDRNLQVVQTGTEYDSIVWDGAYIVSKDQFVGLLDVNLNPIFEMKHFAEVIKFDTGALKGFMQLSADNTEIYLLHSRIKFSTRKEIDIQNPMIFDGKLYFKFRLNGMYGICDDRFYEDVPALYTDLRRVSRSGIFNYVENGKQITLKIK